MRDYLTAREVAELLSVSIDTIRCWRTKRYVDSTKRLIGEALDHSTYLYPVDSIYAWLDRNPAFKPRVVHWDPTAMAPLPSSVISRANKAIAKAIAVEAQPT